MPVLSASQLTIVQTLIDTAPDHAIRSLDMALSAEHGDGAMAAIRDMVSAEAAERRARGMTFGPILRLCPRQAPIAEQDMFPANTVKLLWNALKTEAEVQVTAAMTASLGWRDEEADTSSFDALCATAALGLRTPDGTAFAKVFEVLEEADAGAAERFASHLDLAPLARRAMAQLPEWLGRMTEERAASVRLAFRDAVNISPDGGPRILDILQAQLEEPWQILRVLSAVMDRPSDSYVAGSELAHIGERLLDVVDRRLNELKAFDPTKGAPAGVTAAEAAHVAVMVLTEFDQSLDIKREGPWGSRIARQKRDLAQMVEGRFNKADDAVAAALPLKTVKFAGRMLRGMPRLSGDPDPRAVIKAEGLLAFLHECRTSAPGGGYASLRTKVVEKLDARLDAYAEDLIDHLRGEDGDVADHELARRYLELTAQFVALVRDEKAAQIVRRRAAA